MQRFFIFLLLQLIFSITVNAVELPQFDSKTGKWTNCINTTLTLSKLINDVESLYKVKCTFKAENGNPTLGFFYDCEKNREFKAFRNKNQCESWMKAARGESKLDYLDFIPKDVPNKEGYDVGFDSCVKSTSTKNFPIESVFDYCDCYTRLMAKFSEVELELMAKNNKLNKFVGKNSAACLHILDPSAKHTPELEKELQERASKGTKLMDSSKFIMLNGASNFQVECEKKFGLNSSPKDVKEKCIELEKMNKKNEK